MADFFKLDEPIIAALVEQIRANVAAEIVAINSDVTDGRTIEQPVQILDYAPTPSDLQGGLPIIGVASAPTKFEDDLVTSVVGVHQLVLVGVVANADPGVLEWQLKRYLRLMLNLVQLDRTYGGRCRGTILDRADPGPLVQNTNPKIDATYLSWCWLWLRCSRDEYGG
jgi:hypothetical protein